VDEQKLDALVTEIQNAGMAWIDAQLKARQLEADAKPFLAALMNDMEGSEAARDRQARGSKIYRDYLRDMNLAWAEAKRLEVRYENLQILLEARRSELAMKRAKIEKGIFDRGA
jgi:hypothetical protein